MSRSKWKGPVIHLQNKKINEKKLSFIVSKRNRRITPNFLNKTISVYNGKSYTEITINEDMISHSVGEFVFTRKKFSFPKKKKKKINGTKSQSHYL
jgi:small subunit ribosomal protein S19